MWKLFHRKTVWRPTWSGALVLAAIGLTVFRLSAPLLYRFLSPSDPPAGEYLVIEGWVSDTFLDQVAILTRQREYKKIYCTGGPIGVGQFLSEYQVWAEVGAQRLIRAGFSPDRITAAPSGTVRKDRTYEAALGLRDRIVRDGITGNVSLDLLTQGPHARRSRALYRAALGGKVEVQVLSLEPDTYHATDWWSSSEGFRAVLYETIAYGYTCLWLISRRGNSP